MIDQPAIDALFEAASRAQASAYAPYSGFPVGAALVTETGEVHVGCNVENAAYPAGTCAESGAIAAMAAAGGRRIAAILVVGPGDAPCAPCGACRQRIREFAGPDAVVIASARSGARRAFTLEELLPASFGPEALGRAR